MTPFIGQIQPFGFNFAPRGWAHCDGQLLPIAQYTALFSLLGTTYGGDGRTTFGLPDLRGRSIVHVGNGPGLDTITWGERGGRIDVTMNITNMPSHNHVVDTKVAVNTEDGEEKNPTTFIAAQDNGFAEEASANQFLGGVTTTVGNTGGQQPFNIRNPFLGVYVSIALEGVFPSRN